jgi:hypothetical protein
MPAMYVFAGSELTEALRSRGRVDDARSVLSTAQTVAHAIGLGDLLRGAEQALPTNPPGDSRPPVPLKK